MAKLTKEQTRLHREAVQLLAKDRLTDDDKEFIFTNWNPAAEHNVTYTGTYFTPPPLASDFRLELCGRNILDLCAGIGSLSFYVAHWPYNCDYIPNITAIEINPRFVEIGRKLLPQVNWICGNVFDLPRLVKEYKLPHFDIAYGNPPFGRVSRGPDEKTKAGRASPYKGPRYRGPEFEYHLIDLVSDYADQGVFILPQMSSPFQFSGVQYFTRDKQTPAYRRFETQTGLTGDGGVGIDTAYHKDAWQNITPPPIEIVTYDFTEAQEARKQARKARQAPPAPAPQVAAPGAPSTATMQQQDLFAA